MLEAISRQGILKRFVANCCSLLRAMRRFLCHRLIRRALRFVTLACQSCKFFAPPSCISSCVSEFLTTRSTALTADSKRFRFASFEWSTAHALQGAGRSRDGFPTIAATISAAANAREALSSLTGDTEFKAASRALRIASTLPLGTIWPKRSDASSLESVSAAQPPAGARSEHRSTAQKAIGTATPRSHLGLAMLRSFIVGNQFFQQLALFRSLFSRIVQHVADEIIFGFVFYLASLYDLCVTFRISSPQFRECDNAATSKQGV
jgi:hypothetical protein